MPGADNVISVRLNAGEGGGPATASASRSAKRRRKPVDRPRDAPDQPATPFQPEPVEVIEDQTQCSRRPNTGKR